MASYSATKRFLAGAVCPRCEAMDAIMVYSRDDKDFRECVECGFSDQMHFTQQAQELDTRVQSKPAAEEQTVKIINFDTKPQ